MVLSRGAREIELKLKVDDRAALEGIAAAAGGSRAAAVVQVNRFFDVPSRALQRAGLTVRLRDEDGAWFLTAKGSTRGAPAGAAAADGDQGGALKTHLEEEERVDDAVARAILAGARSPVDVLDDASSASRAALIGKLRAAQGDEALQDVGAFTNRRARVPTTLAGIEVVLELDETTFPGAIVHHEVEVELDEGTDAVAVERALRELLARAGVVGRAAPGKAKRFFAALAGKPI